MTSEPCVYSIQQILELEAAAKAVVWVFAPDIALGPQQFSPVMQNNMKNKQVRYRYLVADDRTTLENLAIFLQELQLGEASSLFEIRVLPSAFIESDVTILDPNTPHEYGFVFAPSEVESQHWRLVGSSLVRTKHRFTELWRLADPVSLALTTPECSVDELTQPGLLRLCWRHCNRFKGDFLESWENLGRDIAGRNKGHALNDPRERLVAWLIKKYSVDRNLLPPFDELVYPEAIRAMATGIQAEAIAAHLAGAESASIGMCGKLLEISLKFYWESHSNEVLDPNIGLGQLIRKVTETFSVQLDEGLKIIVNFINTYRIASVHQKKGFDIPTHEQSGAVLMMTYDTIHKLF